MSYINHPTATWIHPSTGENLNHGALMAQMAQQRVVLLGETHDRYDIHRWQLHVAAGLRAHRADIAMGFEMFPRQVQSVLDEWIEGHLDEAAFLRQVNWDKVWGFAPDLYLPLFHFCRAFRVPMYALNCRRTLVTEVGKLGWDAIEEEDRDGLTPSKPATLEYRQYLANLVGDAQRQGNVGTSPEDLISDRFLQAQQTWDRAFACNIARVVMQPDAPLMIGIIGRGHLEYGHGTPFQLRDLNVDKISVLLPSDAAQVKLAQQAGIGDALFRLTDKHTEHQQSEG